MPRRFVDFAEDHVVDHQRSRKRKPRIAVLTWLKNEAFCLVNFTKEIDVYEKASHPWLSQRTKSNSHRRVSSFDFHNDQNRFET